jgi:hypothetical protein
MLPASSAKRKPKDNIAGIYWPPLTSPTGFWISVTVRRSFFMLLIFAMLYLKLSKFGKE